MHADSCKLGITVTGKCLDRWDLNRAAPVPWVVTDFVVLLAPLPWLKRLNIRHAEKVALIGSFLLGSLYVSTAACTEEDEWREELSVEAFALGVCYQRRDTSVGPTAERTM
jgi:hypothetical protein